MNAIINARVVLPDRVLEHGQIFMEQGRIFAVGEGLPVPEDCVCYDAKGKLAGPGFVDEHCHAGGEWNAYEDPVRMARHHLEGGTTTVLCTIYHNIGVQGAFDAMAKIKAASMAALIFAMAKIKAAMEAGTPGNIAGVHFEGPFMNPNQGCYRDLIRPVSREEYMGYLKEYKDLLKLWMVAPELEGAGEFMDTVRAAGIHLAIGHSEASPECVADAVRRGATICTHICDATGTSIVPSRWEGTLEVPFDVACMLHDELFCEIINDAQGIHVRHDMVKFIIKAVGIDRVIAVTDACTGSTDDTDVNIVDGDLFGSKLRMNQAARNFRRNIGLTEPEVFRVAALNPARALHMDGEVGSLEPGKQANVVILDDDYNVCRVYLRGEAAVTHED